MKRKVITIDVGNMTPKEAEATILKYKSDAKPVKFRFWEFLDFSWMLFW